MCKFVGLVVFNDTMIEQSTNRTINIKGRLVDFSTPMVMGIVNITPDSFYSGSRTGGVAQAVIRAVQVVEQGADIIDIGGQSTSPTSTMLTPQEELERLVPVLKEIHREMSDAVISVDTFYADVARTVVEEYGVAMINDVSGGQIDERMFETVAQLQVPYILMHMRGVPQTMQKLTHYDNLMQDILFYFSEKVSQLQQLGVNDIIIDPGFGFSKTTDQNYELMQNLKYFDIFDYPLLVGISRKSMIYRHLGGTPEESLNGTTVLNSWSLLNGADILRVHDVKEAVEAVELIHKIHNPYKE